MRVHYLRGMLEVTVSLRANIEKKVEEEMFPQEKGERFKYCNPPNYIKKKFSRIFLRGFFFFQLNLN